MVIAQLNQKYLSPDVIHIVGEIDGFPTMKYIANQGKTVIPYNDDRSAKAMTQWIKSTMNNSSSISGDLEDSTSSSGETDNDSYSLSSNEDDNNNYNEDSEDSEDSDNAVEELLSNPESLSSILNTNNDSDAMTHKSIKLSSFKKPKSTVSTIMMGGIKKRRRTTRKGKGKKKKTIKQRGGKKWTRKYKTSINCKRPKGFSQRQYCKYGRKK